MEEARPIIELYFDDAGNTGSKLDPRQRNMFLGAVVIPQPSGQEFWREADDIWKRVQSACGAGSPAVELKGSDLYGGRRAFGGVPYPERQAILEGLIDVVCKHKLVFLWEGVPKFMWYEHLAERGIDAESIPLWDSTLFAFCGLLHDFTALLYDECPLRIIGDENSWVPTNHLLIPPPQWQWPALLDGGVIFAESESTRGLQLADILVHTLYRANKLSCAPPNDPVVSLSPADELADSLLAKLVNAHLCFPLHRALQDLQARRGRDARV